MLKTVLTDMDGVLADFDRRMRELRGGYWDRMVDPPEMFEPGFFRGLPIVPGAKEGIARLLAAKDRIKLYVATKPVRNAHCPGEKILWIEEHFPELHQHIILTCDKGILHGDYLIDDDWDGRWEKVFRGKMIKFHTHDAENSWRKATQEILG
jgi:5'(3')-deoxyribonucleotidase